MYERTYHNNRTQTNLKKKNVILFNFSGTLKYILTIKKNISINESKK